MRRVFILLATLAATLALVIPQLAAGGQPPAGSCPPSFHDESAAPGEPADLNGNGKICVKTTRNFDILIDDFPPGKGH